MIPPVVLLVAVLVLAGLLLALAGTIAVRRVIRLWADRRRARAVLVLRPAVAAVVAEALDSPAGQPAGTAAPRRRAGGPRHARHAGPARRRRWTGRRRAAPAGSAQLLQLATQLPRWQRRVLDDIVLGYLGKVRGPARQPLLELLQHNGTVPRARRRLDHPGLVGRARAAEILGRAGGPDVVVDLVALLFDRQPEVRAVAAAGLAGAPPSPRVVRALLAAVDGDRPVPASLVVDTLVRLGPACTAQLAAALAGGTPHVRAVAAAALGLLGTTEATAALLAALRDPAATTEVQARCAAALGRIGAPTAVDPLIGCLRPDRPAALRAAAARALGDLSSPRAVPYLVPLLSAPYPLASTAAAALTRLGPAGRRVLTDVVAAEPTTPAGRHAAAGLAAAELGTVPAAVAELPAPVG